jgi:biopolymer transport protein ExbD
MRFKRPESPPETGFDLTPMIDVVFQLLIFFMLLLSFDKAEQDQRVKLPVSELAKPPESPYEEALTIQLASDNLIFFAGGEFTTIEQFQSALRQETQIIQAYGDKRVEDVTVIVRADRNAQTGRVQEIIQASQKSGFVKFALRGKQGDVRVVSEED